MLEVLKAFVLLSTYMIIINQKTGGASEATTDISVIITANQVGVRCKLIGKQELVVHNTNLSSIHL